MTRYPTSTAVVESVPVLPWPSEGNEADRQAFWDRRTAGYAEARVRAAAIAAQGQLDVTVVSHETGDDHIDILGATADGIQRIPEYDSDNDDDTTRWGTPHRNVWWIEASYQNGLPGRVSVSAYFNSVEERDAAVARYPKSLNVRATSLHSDTIIPCATLHVGLWSDKVNGGRNETGIARFRRFLALTPRDEIGWAAVYGNAFPNLASLLAVID
jgi:hypothetical protein